MLDMWNLLNKVSAITDIITFIAFLTTLTIVLSRTYRHKRRIKKAIEKGEGLRVALVVDLKPGENMRGQVEAYLKEKGMEMDIYEIDAEGVSLDTLPNLRKNFVAKKRELSDKGVKEIHLFYKGPVASAFFLADTLGNWVPLYIYHLNREGGYECWGLLTESFERMATEEMIKEITESA